MQHLHLEAAQFRVVLRPHLAVQHAVEDQGDRGVAGGDDALVEVLRGGADQADGQVGDEVAAVVALGGDGDGGFHDEDAVAFGGGDLAGVGGAGEGGDDQSFVELAHGVLPGGTWPACWFRGPPVGCAAFVCLTT
ncbi:hypothetical protein [Deinococcus sp. 6YEL10]|uniref:hypothetical protein n=1 Tax=Deinococcus sp. 6YEL10 TaxID=2745870 RepID=UPI001E57DFD0|nr:hypothetical protein [Deinococcus sp. 6YEL10]